MRFFSFFILIIITVLCLPFPSFSVENDGGYFLSLRQKGQLILHGDIYGSDRYCYDILIVPGYVSPTRLARRSWRDAGDEIGEYFHIGKYRHAKRNFSDIAEWTFQDCLWGKTLKGVPNAWRRYFGKANTFAEKRVFGWWMAYPWSFFQSTVDNVIRVPFGLSCAAGGTLVCFIGVPTRHILNSVSKATFIATLGGVALPAVGYTWNTLVSPPLALFGQKPAASRVDGFWVRRTTEEQRKAELLYGVGFTDSELELITQWGCILMDQIPPFDEKRKEIDKKRDEALKKVQADAEKEKQALNEEEKVAYERLITSPETNGLVNELSGKYSRRRIGHNHSQIKRYLMDKGFTDSQCDTVFRLLRAYPPVKIEMKQPRDKTDPVKETINVIDDIE